jgi:sarcosine oxidase
MKVAVVGAGIVGVSTARALARLGHEVVIFEQGARSKKDAQVFHTRGSSHGTSRIVRRAYTDPFYTSVMVEAYPLWAELERDTGTTLIDEVGLVYVGEKSAPSMEALVRGLEANAVAYRNYTRADVSEVSRYMVLGASEVAVHTKEAGYVRADLALVASLADARNHGAKVELQRIEEPSTLLASHDAVVLTCGAWIGRHVPQLAPVVSIQTVAHLAGRRMPGPVFIEDGPLGIYGFPAIDSHGPKIGVHASGSIIDPDAPQRTASTAHQAEIESFAMRRFGLPSAPLEDVQTCLYTRLPNDDFAIGRCGPGLFYASACSGHGFKTAPWVGRVLASLVTGGEPLRAFARIERNFA